MKLLKVIATGVPLFSETCEIDFMALQRVTEENAEKMNCICQTKTQKYYQNNVLSFIGINASGKTTVLKLVAFVCRMLANEPINGIDCREFLDGMANGDEATFDVFFCANDNTVNQLHTVISKKKEKFVISEEYLKTKSVSTVSGKKDMLNFDAVKVTVSRNNDEAFLLDDVSIMVAYNKRTGESIPMRDMLRYTNDNRLSISEDCPPELIAFFDPSIDYLHVGGEGKDADIRLKFKGKVEIKLHQLSELNRYLSSGTIKGINAITYALETFKNGGYLIIDELENHFNREIVSTLLRFYMDENVNSNGAVLVFSTHYSELLDEFERNDNIYIVRNRNGITVSNLSTILKRNDIKKSEAYQSGFLEGTVPMYDAYMELKNSLIRKRSED